MARQFERTHTRFLTVDEVAGILRVSDMTVYRLISAGELPAVRVGRSYRVDADQFDRYLTEHRTAAG